MNKPTLGILMIVKNEAKKLATCLDSVQGWVDEIVILDSGSSDNTEEIAKRYTQNFYLNTQWEGFGKQRQLAQSYMTSDWIFVIDADEVITNELQDSILSSVKNNNSHIAYKVNRLTKAFGKFIYHSGWSPDWVTRLYHRESTHYDDALVHEKVLTSELKVEKLTGRLLHDTIDELSQYTQKTALYMKAWADQREKKKKSSLFSAISHGFFRFFKMYILKKGFLDGRHGLLLALLSANVVFTRYADLWLRQYNKK